jgi:transposase, IS30 family
MSSGRPITDDDRDRIMTRVVSGESARQIGLALGRHHSIISREIDRNGGPESYQSRRAATRANEMKSRPQEKKPERSHRLHEEVSAGLDAQWSPEQISNRLVKDFPDEATMHVSHETIYQTLFVQARGQCRTQLRPALRTGRAHRVPRGSTRPAAARITDMKSIHDRPTHAQDRQVPGHWEPDLIIGPGGKSQALTLLERTTRFLILQKIPYDHRAERVTPGTRPSHDGHGPSPTEPGKQTHRPSGDQDDKGRTTGDCRVRICEVPGVKFPRAARGLRQSPACRHQGPGENGV